MKLLLVLLFVTTSVFAKDLFGTPVSVKLDLAPLKWKTVKNLLESSGRIVGGNVATAGQFPFYLLFIANGSILCGSSLLSATWVITAAHCIVGQPSASVYSKIDYSAQPIWTSQAIGYNYFTGSNGAGYSHDIAMVKLQNAATVSDYINFIALPTSNDNTFAGNDATVAGFGKTADNSSASSVLKYLTTPVITNSACSSYFAVDSYKLCTQSPAGQSVCQGDSGGGLFVGSVNNNVSRTLIGTVSSVAAAGCELGYPAIYVRVSAFLTWINNTLLT